MPDALRLLQAFLSPAIFISAAALLLLSLNARLMGIVGRLRQFHREERQAALAGRAAEAQELAGQIVSVERRAERIRRSFLLTLLSLAGTIITCLLLGLSLYLPAVQIVAVVVFVAAIVSLLVGVLYYIAEILVSLSSVREEARFFHESGAPVGDRRREPRPENSQGGL